MINGSMPSTLMGVIFSFDHGLWSMRCNHTFVWFLSII
jgi:hypothetical protein